MVILINLPLVEETAVEAQAYYTVLKCDAGARRVCKHYMHQEKWWLVRPVYQVFCLLRQVVG